MKNLAKVVAAALLAAGMATAVRAEGPIEKRKENQQARIAQGGKSGSLTARETARIEKREAKLNHEIRRDRRDGGGLTAKERAKINHQQNKLSKEIYKQKHDGQVRKK